MNPNESFVDNEIVVDLAHRDLVVGYLNDVDTGEVNAEPGDTNELLGLGVVRLLAVAKTADKFMVDWGERIPINPQPVHAGAKLSDTTKILDGLRVAIGAAQGGWWPRMGKMREAMIGALPHIGAGWEYPTSQYVGAQGALEPADSPDGQDVRIGMIDSRMYPHPELDERWSALPGFATAWQVDEEYPWLLGHAVFGLGRLLERAPGARPWVRGVLEIDPYDNKEVPKATVWHLAKAMTDAANANVQILNLSLGCYTSDGQAPFILERAVDVLSRKGIVIVAAAGNHGEGKGPVVASGPIFPAACPGVVAVGAFGTAKPYSRASFSPPEAPWIALGAPGDDVRSTYLHGHVRFSQLPGLPEAPADQDFPGHAQWSGTSFAAATVSGEIARFMTLYNLSAPEAVAKLRDTDPNDNDGIGWDRKP